MRKVTVAATQMACSWDRPANLREAEALVREAAAAGAGIVLLQELFETPYFCLERDPRFFALAHEARDNPALAAMSALAAELGVVIPVSFFERRNAAYFNSLAVIDADGRNCGLYRKSHIPDAYGYQEKFYFSPGDTGLKVFDTKHAKLGVAVCWDQWFPEAARVMALQGAEILMYPTAIGSEPRDSGIDSRDHWRRAMQGHAAANMIPVVAANRVGTEREGPYELEFYGSSFITDHLGAVAAEAGRTGRAVITAEFDLDRIAEERTGWGLFRDRRPDLYAPLLGLDGTPPPG